MSLSRVSGVSLATGIAALAGAGIALGSSAPLPKAGSAYVVRGGKLAKTFTLTLVVSHASARRIDAGPAVPPIGSQFALSVGSVKCPRAKRNPGLAKGEAPFGLFSFPGARLKLRHGRYSFSVTAKVAKESLLGSPVAPFKLTVKLTGTVTSTNAIKGRVKVKGGPCTVAKPFGYRAVYDKSEPVSPTA
jgi:hypothetical protein